MKATLNTKQLLKALKAAKTILSRNAYLPILEDVKFEIRGQIATLTVSDLENTLIQELSLQGTGTDGAACIPFADLLTFIQGCKETAVTIEAWTEIKKEKQRIDKVETLVDVTYYKVNVGGLKLAGHDSEDFPETPQLGTDAPLRSLNFSPILFHEFKTAAAFLGKDELRPVMCGVNIIAESGQLKTCATDAHRLYKGELGAYNGEDFSFIVAGKAVRQSVNIFDTSGDIEVTWDGVNVAFEQGGSDSSQVGVRLISRLIDGKYPNFEAVIPKYEVNAAEGSGARDATFVNVDKATLIQAINRVKIAARKSTNQTVLTITDGNLNLACYDTDFDREMNVDIQAAAYFSDGEQGCEIALNLKFTLEVLNSMLGSEITFQIGSPNHAVVLQEFHRTFLLMPVMINKPEPVSETESEDEGVDELDELETEIEDIETEIED
jgi:DNA polymerase-3 subunit beta